MAIKNVPAGGITEDQVKLLILDGVKALLTSAHLAEMLKDAGFIIITEGRVNELVAEGYQGTVDLIAEAIKVIPNEDRIRELIAEGGFQSGTLLQGLSSTADDEKPPFDPDWLEGLVFKGAQQVKEKAEKGQRPKMTFKAYERPLTAEDVLSYSVGADSVTLVTADGKKHTVEI